MAWPAHTAPASGAYSNAAASKHRQAAKTRRSRWVDRFKLFSELSQRQYYKPGVAIPVEKDVPDLSSAGNGWSIAPAADSARTVTKNSAPGRSRLDLRR